MAMNFTGSSTYTSLSGVKKEMKISLPLQIGFAITGIALHIIGKLI
jgi:acetyl-CoA decarbonylase/synthase complex subunit gamma